MKVKVKTGYCIASKPFLYLAQIGFTYSIIDLAKPGAMQVSAANGEILPFYFFLLCVKDGFLHSRPNNNVTIL